MKSVVLNDRKNTELNDIVFIFPLDFSGFKRNTDNGIKSVSFTPCHTISVVTNTTPLSCAFHSFNLHDSESSEDELIQTL